MRPKGFLIITLLLGLFSFSPIVSFGSYYAGPLWDFVLTALFIDLGLIITIFFWLRFNWARIIIQLGYLLICAAFIDYFRSNTQQPQTPLQWNVWMGQTVFGVFLLYWLNTKKVRAYFKERKLHSTVSQADYNGKPPIPEP